MYRKVAVFLWGGVSLAVGLSVGVYFDMSDKKIIFVVVAAIGLYLLALLRWSKKGESGEDVAGSGDNDISSAQQANRQIAYEEKDDQEPVVEMMGEEGKPADNESRVWLDDFLVKQQKD